MIRCDGCKRHIFETETACPFCTAPRRRLRNGLLAAGLAVLTGCPVSAVYGAPPERFDAGSDAEIADAQTADARPNDGAADAAADAAAIDMAADAEVDMPIAVPPYGVPPEER